jgi:Holliday junction resolvase
MASDIEKLSLIHHSKRAFDLDKASVSAQLKQVSPEKRNNADRFFRGYEIEDRFGIIYGTLPWVKLLHGLGQEQTPETSKTNFQVPDYLILFESSSRKNLPILIEVKSRSGNKKSLELMERQFRLLRAYATSVGAELLFSIYWEKARLWTLNASDIFESRRFKIGIEESIKNDLSVILGDLTFIIPKIYRSSVFDSSIQDEARVRHENYGAVVSDQVGLSRKNLHAMEPHESVIVDSYIKMSEVHKSRKGTITKLLEESTISYMLKLSTILTHYLPTVHADITHENALISRKIIIEFMKKIGVIQSFSIPSKRTPITDKVFLLAFKDTWVGNNYLGQAEVDERGPSRS